MPGPGLRLRRLHGVGQGLVEVAVVSHRGVPVLARDEVLFGDGDDEGAGVPVEGSGAEEVEALRVFFLGGQEREERKRCQRQFLSDFSSLSLSHPPPPNIPSLLLLLPLPFSSLPTTGCAHRAPRKGSPPGSRLVYFDLKRGNLIGKKVSFPPFLVDV